MALLPTDWLTVLAKNGTLVNYGMMSGEAAQVSSANLIFKDITVRGFWLALWFQNASKEQQQALYGELAKLIANRPASGAY